MAWTFHLFEAIKTNIDWTPICEHHGESVGKSLISLKPWAQSLAFVTFSPFLILRLKTHLMDCLLRNILLAFSSFLVHSFLLYLLDFLLLSCRYKNTEFLWYLAKYLHYCFTLCVDYLFTNLWGECYHHQVCYSILCYIYQ